MCVCVYRTTNNELKLNSMGYKQAKYVIHNHQLMAIQTKLVHTIAWKPKVGKVGTQLSQYMNSYQNIHTVIVINNNKHTVIVINTQLVEQVAY